ncbi:MAG: pyridoxal 5'-phosphate synthase glutaminase subunit PdxT [Firmicutes bacterium]|nr:pyridoxal 5'-phosphate synthase glutaminase subunit PdxT [Alicyclobacillaceae bacterium]MCL6496113.1 pyridoxal 5'-phosphate synthase glutaminase subunit PdxT [Bacillota bacterium]
MRIGVLAIQGDVREHLAHLRALGVDAVPVRSAEAVQSVDGLILPGGESTTIGMLMQEYGVDQAILSRRQAEALPMWGTCAGTILLAREVHGWSPARLGLMDIAVDRNAYGRQLASFEVAVPIPVLGEPPFPAVFIRAPRITRLGPGVRALASHDGSVVMAEADDLLVTTFHPEMTPDRRVHAYFVDMVAHRRRPRQ